MNNNLVIACPNGYIPNTNSYHLFKVTDYYDNSSSYSQYLTRCFSGSDLLVATTGLDTGENFNIKNIIYYNVSGQRRDVLLNVYCDYLNVSAPLDNITRRGEVNNLFIPSNYTGNFAEYGVSSYIQVSGGDFSLKGEASTDLFEIPSGCSVTTHQESSTTVLSRLNAPDIACQADLKIKNITESDFTESTIASDLQNLLNDTQYNFYRLNTEARDIVIKEGKLEVTRNIFFDLNGRSITFVGGADVPIKISDTQSKPFKAAFYVNSSTAKKNVRMYLMDSQSTLYQRSGINIADCSFIVAGNDDNGKTTVELMMNSGKIHDIRGSTVAPDGYNSAAVLVFGNITNDANRTPNNAKFTMYGGYIKSEKGAEYKTESVSSKCIQPRGKGAVIDMVYGDLESFHFCISGQGTPQAVEEKSVDQYGETEIIITGGTFIGGKGVDDSIKYCPLFFPQSGKVTIKGGTFTGPTCINIKAGELNIEGGVFNATREYVADAKAWNDGPTTDGSVIFLESNNFYTGATKYKATTEYNVKITVDNATMTSANGHILKCSGYVSSSKIGQPNVNAEFNGGTFVYSSKRDKAIIKDTLAEGHFIYQVNGGSWSQA